MHNERAYRLLLSTPVFRPVILFLPKYAISGNPTSLPRCCSFSFCPCACVWTDTEIETHSREMLPEAQRLAAVAV